MSIMKKFNFLAIATIALTSVFGFTSCDKSNDSINDVPASQSKQEANMEYQLFVSNEVLDLGDYVFTVENNGQTTTYKASEGQATSKTMKISKVNADPEIITFYGKTVVMKDLKAGAKVTVEFVANESAIAALPADGKIDTGFSILLRGTNSKGQNVSSNEDMPGKGLKNANVLDFLTRKSTLFSKTIN